MTESTYDIQRLVEETGVPRRTIHFYVQQGILPPPQGAGLGATYGEGHLLRLRLIPVLRERGLRLDEIRRRFTGLDLESLRRMLFEDQGTSAQGVITGAPPPASHKIREQIAIPSAIHAEPVGHLYRHYTLPGGVTILAPERLSPADRRRLEQLLQAAQQIYAAPGGVFYAAGNHAPDSDPSQPA